MAVATIYSTLMNYGHDPERVEHGFTATVAVISKIAGMKTRTLQNILSLLMLPPKIRDAVGDLENLRLFFRSVIKVIDRAKAGGRTAKEPLPLKHRAVPPAVRMIAGKHQTDAAQKRLTALRKVYKKYPKRHTH